jgi:prolyl-tRNA synthetase
MGALVMTQSDNNGLVLPPRLAPIQVVFVPIFKNNDELAAFRTYISDLVEQLKKQGISVKIDDSDHQKPGWKFAEYELKGVPVRVAAGPRDIAGKTLEISRRDLLTKEIVPAGNAVAYISNLLEDIQKNLYNRSLEFREKNTFEVDTYDEFKVKIEEGGFIKAHWDGTAETENKIKEETRATIRCIPVNEQAVPGTCMVTGNHSERKVIFAKAY